MQRVFGIVGLCFYLFIYCYYFKFVTLDLFSGLFVRAKDYGT